MSCHTGVYPLQPSLLASLSELSSGFRPLDQILVLLVSVWVGAALILIDHLLIILFVWVWVGTTPISIGHHLVSSSSVWVETAPISIDHVPIAFMFSSIRDRTYIDRPSSYHLVCLSLSQDNTYINRSSSCQFEFNLSRDRTYIDRPCSYHFSCSVWIGTAPISIGHSSCQF